MQPQSEKVREVVSSHSDVGGYEANDWLYFKYYQLGVRRVSCSANCTRSGCQLGALEIALEKAKARLRVVLTHCAGR